MKFRDLNLQYIKYKSEIDSAIHEVIESSSFIGGIHVEKLEKELAEYVGVKHCLTCANGTEAMTLVMMAWGITKGDAVFVPNFTFFATGEVVAFRDASPVFVDVDERSYNIDPEKLEKTILKIRAEGKLVPKAIITVDLFGLPANYPEIERIANKYGLLILEDGAQGFGGNIKGRKACSFGNVATTSFFPAKPLGCYGDGGAIFTNDSNLAKLINSLRAHGMGEDRYDNLRVGLNSRLDAIQAAILIIKLKAFINHELVDINKIVDEYNNRLKSIVEVPYVPDNYYSSFAQYTVKLKDQKQRDGLKKRLEEVNIPSMIYYPKPMHRQEAFLHLKMKDEDFSVTNKLCDTLLSLPIHPYLKEYEIEKICYEVQTYLEK